MENKLTSHIYKGCCIAVAYIFLKTIIFYAGLQHNEWADLLAWIIVIGGTLFSVNYYGKLIDTPQTFGSLFAHGFKTTSVATCFIFIYTLAMVYIINKNLAVEFVNNYVEQARKANPIDDKEIASRMPDALKVARIIIIAKTIMGTLFLGSIGSVLGAVITTRQTKTH